MFGKGLKSTSIDDYREKECVVESEKRTNVMKYIECWHFLYHTLNDAEPFVAPVWWTLLSPLIAVRGAADRRFGERSSNRNDRESDHHNWP
jgi:hypothetical protein